MGHLGPLPESSDQNSHLILPLTLLPNDVIAQRISQLHSLAMTEVVDYLADEYGWSASVPNLSGKLRRGSLRYGEAVELADALGYDIIWKKRER